MAHVRKYLCAVWGSLARTCILECTCAYALNSFRFGQANVCMERSVSGLALEVSQLEETLSLAHCEAQHVRGQVCALPWRSDVGAS